MKKTESAVAIDHLLKQLAACKVELWPEGDRVRYRVSTGQFPSTLREQLREHREELLLTLRERAALQFVTHPVSWNQFGMWFTHESSPLSAAYHIGFAVRIVSPLNVRALQSALQALIDRHESLRTTFTATSGEPTQVICGYRQVDFDTVDCEGLGDDGLFEVVRETHERPIDLERGSVMRARLFTRALDNHVLLVTWHHIAVDGWSTWLLLDEFRVLYEAHASAGPASLPRPGCQYSAYARWQRDLLESPDGNRLWDYWHERLAGAQRVNLPLDRLRIAEASPVGRTLAWQVAADRVERLKALAGSERASFFVVLLSIFKTLLYRYTGQRDLLVGTPTFGRSRPEFQGLVGDLINTVPLRTDLSGEPTFRELVSRVRETILGALEHADYPFALLVRQLGLRRDPGRSPLLDVLFNFQTPQRSSDLLGLFLETDSPTVVNVGGMSLQPFPIPQQEGQFDLSLEALEQEGRLRGSFKYRSDIFEPSTIERMAQHWLQLVDSVVASPDARISELRILPDDERRLLTTWNETTRPFAGPYTLHGPFEERAKTSPDAVAVVDGQEQLTYGQLNQLAERIASHLRKQGARPGARVGIAVERTVTMVAALLGILKTGAAYLPLDPTYPRERLTYMVEDGEVLLVLTERALTGDVAHKPAMGINAPIPIVYLEDCLQVSEPANRSLGPAAPDDVAYMIYTSGSTGRPKGVLIPHRAAASMLYAFRTRFNMTNSDRWVALTTLSFDISVLEIFGPLSCGASVFVTSRIDAVDPVRLVERFNAWRPTFLQATPTTWQMVLDAGWAGDAGLTILAGGEALTSDLVARLRSRCARLFNAYGPTETTVWATASEISDAAAPVTIGRPLANVSAYVLDQNTEPMPVGLPGELYIGGAGVALGYHARDALTAERFVLDPFRPAVAARMYRTGDLVRWRGDGELEFLGRLDDQVKVRGHRIELGEIENALARHPAVRQAVVTAQASKSGDRFLVAHLVPAAHVDAGDLRRFLRDSLPDYMIPAFFQMLEQLPRTPSGKVDRSRLSALELDATRTVVGPRTELEASLVRLWEEALDVRPIGVTDNFFDLGGHSLLATRLCAQLSEQTGHRLHVATFFQAPTIAELAARLSEQPDQSAGLLVPLRTHGLGTPYFCVPGIGDNPFIFADLARHLATDRPVYAFRFPDEAREMQSSPRELVTTIARELVDRVRSVQPRGPYLLGGYCFGGLIAFEMAQQLRDSGEPVAALTIFEMFLPGASRLPDARDRLAYHLRFLRSVGWRDRIGFVKRHGRRRLARFGRRLSPRLGDAVAQLTLPSAGDFSPHRAYAGRLTLFRGSEQPDGLTFDHDMGWGGLASEGVVVHEMDGHHTDAYKEPSISKWISALRDTLEQADSQRGEGNEPRRQGRLAELAMMLGSTTGYLASQLL
jgi:amino acid adenylation domain-containing protein